MNLEKVLKILNFIKFREETILEMSRFDENVADYDSFKAIENDCIQALDYSINELSKQDFETSGKFNGMLDSFSCDFSLIDDGNMSFSDLEREFKNNNEYLLKDMSLLSELSFLLKTGRAKIVVQKGGL